MLKEAQLCIISRLKTTLVLQERQNGKMFKQLHFHSISNKITHSLAVILGLKIIKIALEFAEFYKSSNLKIMWLRLNTTTFTFHLHSATIIISLPSIEEICWWDIWRKKFRKLNRYLIFSQSIVHFLKDGFSKIREAINSIWLTIEWYIGASSLLASTHTTS